MPLSYKSLQLLTPEFFIPYFQYVVFIVIGTGILFSIIFHVGVKEHPRDCSLEFVTSSCKRSAANWKAWFREPRFYQVLIYLVIFIYVLSSMPSLPNSRFLSRHGEERSVTRQTRLRGRLLGAGCY